jgi:hypothetical protein
MKLDAWLRQRHPPAERFRLLERLSQAVNAVHDRGEALAALQPDRVEVGADLVCDLSAAGRGAPEPGYSAPERLEGSSPSPEADIYSAGAIAWEVLVGRPCGEEPAPLTDVVPDLPHEIAGAVMGCLERSPQWRPKDLTYLAQLAAAQQKGGRRNEAPASSRPTAARPARTAPPRESRSHWTLILAGVLLLAVAALSYRMISGQMSGSASRSASVAGTTARARPGRPSPAPSATVPAPSRTAAHTSTPSPTPAPEPTATPSLVQAPAAAVPTPAATPVPTPTPSPVSTPTPTSTPPPATAVPTAAAPTAAAPAKPAPARAAVEPPPVREAVELTSLSPTMVRRPGKAMFDLHGTGLRADLIVRIMARREMPRGITVTGQKWVSANLMTILLELDGSVKPAVYAIALVDPTGGPLKTLPFTVTK